MKKMIFLIAAAVMTIAATASADREFSFDKKQDFDGDAIKSVSIDFSSGNISIVKSEDSKVRVEFKNEIRADNEDKAEKLDKECDYEARLDGDRLVIDVYLPRVHSRDVLEKIFTGNWNNNIHLMMRLSIPDGKSVDIKTSSADIEVSGTNLDLDVRGSSSDIQMKNTDGNFDCDLSSGDVDIYSHDGNASINGKSSDVRINGIRGNLEIYTSSGDGRVENVTGSAIISTSSGDFKVFDVGGDLEIRSSSGDLYVDGVSGSVRAKSSSGDMRLSTLSAEEGDFDIDSVSGDVTVEISPDFKGSLSLKTSSGDITSHVSAEIETSSDSRLTGSIDKGNGRLRVATSSGDIRVSRY